jgi:hypothetical protein
MINRRATVYRQLPEELAGNKAKEAKLAISINMVVPKEMEGKKATEFIDDEIDQIAKDFKKFIDKRAQKLLDKD